MYSLIIELYIEWVLWKRGYLQFNQTYKEPSLILLSQTFFLFCIPESFLQIYFKHKKT